MGFNSGFKGLKRNRLKRNLFRQDDRTVRQTDRQTDRQSSPHSHFTIHTSQQQWGHMAEWRYE